MRLKQVLSWLVPSVYGLCDDNHKEATTNQKKAYSQGRSRVGITMTNMREQQTLIGGVTSVVCQCGRFYKNNRGLQIHPIKSGCQICENALATHIFTW